MYYVFHFISGHLPRHILFWKIWITTWDWVRSPPRWDKIPSFGGSPYKCKECSMVVHEICIRLGNDTWALQTFERLNAPVSVFYSLSFWFFYLFVFLSMYLFVFFQDLIKCLQDLKFQSLCFPIVNWHWLTEWPLTKAYLSFVLHGQDFSVIFCSTQKCVNRDNVDFASKPRKSRQDSIHFKFVTWIKIWHKEQFVIDPHAKITPHDK